ncbi:hypothetical protein IC235_13225 [Hymenobacter sp. BT664]|uniref:Secreted protein n=1 Tax=Hymenobacter montanus TaxID=2771359 RepID=A0A927GK74_9BACT|nr:hypothetical protein [Hymenobacter montanus]MBD2768851.1 hypothetical protein [Hymenobacter montanus]
MLPLRRLLATSFLLVFVNVLAGQCWCATTNPASAAPALVAKVSTPEKPAHPGCPGHGKPGAKQTPAQGKHAQQPTKPLDKHGCCKDNSASVLASLTTPGEKHLLAAPAPALLPAGNDFFFRPAAGRWNRTQAVILVLREHLPPKIPDIRIFIQSLTV